MEWRESYFNPLIKKEMMEKKMSETYEVPAKVSQVSEDQNTVK